VRSRCESETAGALPANVYFTIAIRLRYDYDEKLTCYFFARVASRRMEAGARDTSLSDRIIYRSRIVISITSVVVECVVVSSYRSRIVVESQL